MIQPMMVKKPLPPRPAPVISETTKLTMMTKR